MKIIRLVLGQIILFFDWLFQPKRIQRTTENQTKVDGLTKNLALYQFKACPFCVKVRRQMKRLNLNVELREVTGNLEFEKELIEGGGARQVPCLRIKKPDGSFQWMYESSDINQFLAKQVESYT